MKILATAALLGWTAGCAVMDSTIAINHDDPAVGARLASPRRFSLAAARSMRGDESAREGVKKNGFGMEGASILTDPKPDQIVSRALTVELRAAGFEIASGAPASIVVEIHQFFAEPEVGLFAGDVYAVVDATVTVALDGERTFKRRFTGIGKSTTLVFYQKAIEGALNDFLTKSVPAIVTLAHPAGW